MLKGVYMRRDRIWFERYDKEGKGGVQEEGGVQRKKGESKERVV